MGKQKKNKPTPKPEEQEKQSPTEETQDLIVDVSQIPDEEVFKEEETLQPPIEKEEEESKQEEMQPEKVEKPKSDRVSFSDMLRNRRKSFKRN
jgi:hypothetical protein